MILMQAQGGLRNIPKSGGERNGVVSLSPELMQLKKMREEERYPPNVFFDVFIF